jgi:hypothetical protein
MPASEKLWHDLVEEAVLGAATVIPVLQSVDLVPGKKDPLICNCSFGGGCRCAVVIDSARVIASSSLETVEQCL